MTQEFAVSVNNLKVAFGEFMAVNDVTFQVEKGEIFGFLGANGAGKTTTIRVLCGLLPPSGGSAVVARANAETEPQIVKSRVGYMSQKFTLYPDLTIAENLNFMGRLRRLTDEYTKQRIAELTKFIEFDRPLNTLVGDLPGGVLQQVALVSATVHDPEIVFLDEPTAGVTPHARAKFWDLIHKMASAGKTIFVTTHYMDEAEQCNRIALMRAGQIIALGAPKQIKADTFPEPIYELTAPEDAPADWAKKLSEQDFFMSMDIFGMRYHLHVFDEHSWESYRSKNLHNFQSIRIPPTLEDVFIRLVEGKNR